MKNYLTIFIVLLSILSVTAQDSKKFTKADRLRGEITKERAWWDLKHYNLSVEVFPEKKSIKGTNIMTYKVIDAGKSMQIDLQPPMKIDKVTLNGKKVKVKRDGNAHFFKLKRQEIGKEYKITIHFSGTPKEAVKAPWDGGFTWKKDEQGKHFIATANQSIGSSIWWPNKDHYYDEPDNGINLAITAPKDLVGVGNGRLKKTDVNGKTKTWHWEVVNPINNYGVNINIGNYVNFTGVHEGLNGNLDMSYWVLEQNLEKAKVQFEQAPMTIRAFEYWFGPYPFYEDSFKLVEVPYLGMEHQSSITYGNGYSNGYRGRDLSNSGWGLQFDFIIVHESGHEWFANNITNVDVADMWIHESFTNYSESLFLNYHFSEEAASEYIIGLRNNIQNDRPIIGTYNVHHEGSGDMYYKGSNMLHTLRQLVDDDRKWREILTGLNTTFRHQTVTGKQVEEYISTQTGMNLLPFWNQYLRTIEIPTLEYELNDNKLVFRYVNTVKGFEMPLKMIIDGEEKWIYPTSEWKTETFSNMIQKAQVKTDFYINSQQVNTNTGK